MYTELIELSGHIIDSLVLTRAMDEIIAGNGDYAIEEISIGVHKDDPSYARLRVRAVRVGNVRREVFAFMSSAVSSEKPKQVLIGEIAREMREIRERGGRILFVCGPALVHTGAARHLAQLVEAGYVNCVFGGNALAAHDIEAALCGTSLGVNLASGVPAARDHEHHLRAINTVRTHGSIKAAVEAGVLREGLMYTLERNGIPYVLAGSIRDDGPLPEVITDLREAQNAMRAELGGVELVVAVATMLHAIAVGNMLPAAVKFLCVDINPAVVTKLADRGSFQTMGIVTDVESFMRELCRALGLGSPL